MPKFSSVVSRRRRFSSVLAVLALAVLTAAGCDSSTGNDDSLASLTVNPPTPVLHIGGVQQLTATPATASGKIIEGRTITWSSSAPAIATVDGNGFVTAIAGGTSTISASVGGLSDDAVLTVWHPVQSVTLASAGAATTMCQEGALQLTPTYIDVTGATVTGRQSSWTTSNPAGATVSVTGRLTGGAAGGPLPLTTTITAVTEGVPATFDITTDCVAVVVETELEPTLGVHFAVGMTDQFVVIPRAASGTALDTTGRVVEFESSDTLVATVSATGLVTMVAEGEADITGTVDGEEAVVTVTSYTQLLSATPVVMGLVAADASVFFVIDVPVGATELKVVTAGGSGDPDVYLYGPANADDVIDASERGGPAEEVLIANPTPGRYLFEFFAWGGAGSSEGTTVTATVTP